MNLRRQAHKFCKYHQQKTLISTSYTIPLQNFLNGAWDTKASFSTLSNSLGSKVFKDAQTAVETLLFQKEATKDNFLDQKDDKSTINMSKKDKGDGITVGVGGFGLGGIPETLINTLAENQHFSNLTVVSLTAGIDGFGLGRLFESRDFGSDAKFCDSRKKVKVKRIIASYVGENKNLEKMFLNGEIEIELVPQGTLAMKMNAAGAGIPAFFTPAGIGTMYANGGIPIQYNPQNPKEILHKSPPKRKQKFSNQEYILEEALHTDLSIIKAYKADTLGNLVFRGTSRNSNPDVAMAGKICIAEAEHIVQAGKLDPDEIHLPGIFVDGVIHALDNEKRIERLRVQQQQTTINSEIMNKIETNSIKLNPKRMIMIRRAAKEFKNGMHVNLGIGIPTLASNYLPPDVKIFLHSENGLIGVGPYPLQHQVDSDFINAGKETITALPGASTFSSSNSFDMVRGGHIDLTLLGGLECSQSGDLANWIIPRSVIKGMSGAMDLVGAPGARVVVVMDHTSKDGKPKIVKKCSLPLTGEGVVDRIITDMCVFDCDKKNGGGLELVEIAPNVTLEDVKNCTGCDFNVVTDSCGNITIMNVEV